MKSAWPVIEFPTVFHLGTMQPSDKGKSHNANSLEGAGLSVSIHPRAWRQIARLGGQPCWGLRAGQGTAIRFVDAHALTSEHLEQMYQWASKVGLVHSTELAVLTWVANDECGESPRQTMFDLNCNGAAGRQAQWDRAQEELEECLAGDEGASLQVKPGYGATDLLAAKSGHRAKVPPLLVQDLVLAVYSDEVLSSELGVHGVWWADELDVGALSAPRGVIHPGVLPSPNVQVIREQDMPWDADDAAMDEPEDDAIEARPPQTA